MILDCLICCWRRCGSSDYGSRNRSFINNSEQRGFVGIDLTNWPKLKVAPGMAAEKAGVTDGDIAVQVNGKDISHIESPTDALDLFFGKAGESVALTVKREEQILTVEIVREPLPQ